MLAGGGGELTAQEFISTDQFLPFSSPNVDASQLVSFDAWVERLDGGASLVFTIAERYVQFNIEAFALHTCAFTLSKLSEG